MAVGGSENNDDNDGKDEFVWWAEHWWLAGLSCTAGEESARVDWNFHRGPEREPPSRHVPSVRVLSGQVLSGELSMEAFLNQNSLIGRGSIKYRIQQDKLLLVWPPLLWAQILSLRSSYECPPKINLLNTSTCLKLYIQSLSWLWPWGSLERGPARPTPAQGSRLADAHLTVQVARHPAVPPRIALGAHDNKLPPSACQRHMKRCFPAGHC